MVERADRDVSACALLKAAEFARMFLSFSLSDVAVGPPEDRPASCRDALCEVASGCGISDISSSSVETEGGRLGAWESKVSGSCDGAVGIWELERPSLPDSIVSRAMSFSTSG